MYGIIDRRSQDGNKQVYIMLRIRSADYIVLQSLEKISSRMHVISEKV